MRHSLCLPFLLVAVGLPLRAQEPGREVVECRGQPISTITIETRPPFTASSSTFVTRTAQLARRVHATTKPRVVRRYLALEQGGTCTELRRSESERILRAQPFIADAAVTAYSDGPDSVSVHVTTIDEFSVVLDGSFSGNSPHVRSARFGNANLMGGGIYGAFQWRDGGPFRDGYGTRLVHYQLFGRPYQFEADFVRRDLGHDIYVEASHPYLTPLQRVAWRTHYGVRDWYSEFLRGADTSAWLALKQTFADMGGVVRIGGPITLVLVGGSLSQERDQPASSPVVIGDGFIRPDTSSVLLDRYPMRRQTRANALFGFRSLRFMRVIGFETLDGVQDVPRGFQFSALLGRGMTILDKRSDRGVFASTSLYGGVGSPVSFVGADLNIEARRETHSREWVGVISSLHAGWYRKHGRRHTLVSRLEWSGGWKSRVPFQLSFADREGGLRGFHDSRLGGGQRLVLRVEDRYFWGHWRRYGTFGLAGFTDVGKLWAGDAPFGMDSRTSASIGVSLLASIPPRSKRLIRVDVAYPLNPDGKRSLELRLTSRVATSLPWREPRDVRHARERSVPNSVFNWP